MMTIFGDSFSQSRIFAIGNDPSLLWNSRPKKIGLVTSTALGFIAVCYVWQNSNSKNRFSKIEAMTSSSSIYETSIKKERQTKFNWLIFMIAVAKARKAASFKTFPQEKLIFLGDQPQQEEKDALIDTQTTLSVQSISEITHEPPIIQNSDDPTNQARFLHTSHSKETKPLETNKQERKIEKTPSLSDITPAKSKALADYKSNPSTCRRVSKTIIFKDIKQIKPQDKNYDRIDSVVGLMLYVSNLIAIDLLHEKCIQVILDTIREGDKETSLQLITWLGDEKKFHIDLWMNCVQVFIDKAQRQAPFNSVALEKLIKIYKERSWHQLCNSQNSLIVPLNHSLIKSAMSILNEIDPQNEKIKALNKWIQDQQSSERK